MKHQASAKGVVKSEPASGVTQVSDAANSGPNPRKKSGERISEPLKGFLMPETSDVCHWAMIAITNLVIVLGLPFVMAWDLIEQMTRRLRGAA